MKRKTFLTLLLLASLFGLQAKNYAFLIGIDQYSGKWPTLKNAVNDCQALETLLKTDYRFDRSFTLYNDQATRQNILEELQALGKLVKSEDNLLIYFAGHGFIDEANEGYWVPAEAQTKETYQCVSNSEIRNAITKIKSLHTLLIVDACFSGTLFRSASIPENNHDTFYENMKSNPSRQALSSGGIQEVVDGGGEGHSVFASFLLKRLRENQQPQIEASEIALYLKITVPANTPNRQQPEFGHLHMTGHQGGSFVFEKRQVGNAPEKSASISATSSLSDKLGDAAEVRSSDRQAGSIILYSGKKGGTYHSVSTDIAHLSPLEIQVVESQGSFENMKKCAEAKDTIALGLVQADVYYKLKKEFPNLSVLSILYPEELHLLTVNSSDIHGIEDLKNKRIGIPGRFSGTASTFDELTNLFKLGSSVVYKEEEELFRYLLDRKIDALFFIGGAPLTFLSTLEPEVKAFIRLVPLNQPGVDRIFDKTYIKKSNYEWLNEDVSTYGISSFLITNEEIDPKSKSYAIVNDIINSLKTLSLYGHPKWKDFNPEVNLQATFIPEVLKPLYRMR